MRVEGFIFEHGARQHLSPIELDSLRLHLSSPTSASSVSYQILLKCVSPRHGVVKNNSPICFISNVTDDQNNVIALDRRFARCMFFAVVEDHSYIAFKTILVLKTDHQISFRVVAEPKEDDPLEFLPMSSCSFVHCVGIHSRHRVLLTPLSNTHEMLL